MFQFNEGNLQEIIQEQSTLEVEAAIPEPSTYLLLGSMVTVISLARRKRKAIV